MLAIQWIPKTDEFQYRITLKICRKSTKRNANMQSPRPSWSSCYRGEPTYAKIMTSLTKLG